MRLLLQRVSRAEVRVDGVAVGAIGRGLLALLGVGPDDTPETAGTLARRTVELRIFRDDAGKTNLSLAEVGGSVLVVSQFTLYADTSRGRRPSFIRAAPAALAEALFDSYCRAVADLGVPVSRGRFGAEMSVELVNDGPFTIWLDSLDAQERRADPPGSPGGSI